MATGLFNLKQVNQAISQGAWSGYIAPRWVEYLVVAGGGGGGCVGGGAGAGGLLTGIVTVSAGASYTVTIGSGGSGGPNTTQAGSNGVASVFGAISTTGGGGGGSNGSTTGPSISSGRSGGSGGGVGSAGIGGYSVGQGTSGQGNAGGNGLIVGTGYPSGGGGGAGTVGISGSGTTVSGNGGAGIASAITGSVVTYAGGGGGGSQGGTAGTGGVGGGGSGTNSVTTGATGGGNTGGGGGGGGYGGGDGLGGAGGSGIVVVRYPGNVQFYTGGTVTYSNGYIVHNFTANGTLAPTTPTVVSEYQISRSLRFNGADSAYLNRTPATATNRKTWTWSGWVKRSGLNSGGEEAIFIVGPTLNEGGYFNIAFSSDKFVCGTGAAELRATTAVYRDISAWYHLVVAVDTTQATASDRVKMYVNGGQVTAFTTNNNPTQNLDTAVNSTVAHNIGRNTYNSSNYFDGYITEMYLIDGQALTPTSFGYVNPTTGIWSPAKYVGGYGTNGFYLNFSDNSNTTAATLGADSSGNGNNWTPNNFSVTAGAGNDSLVDSPTSYGTDTGVGGTVRGNYSTLNPLNLGASATLANGNLNHASTSGSWTTALSTIGMTSGQWYFEATITSSGNHMVGIANQSFTTSAYLGENVNSWGYYSSGEKYTGVTSGTAYGASYTNGDVIGVALDMDAGTITFYKNGTSQGQAFSGLTGPLFFGVSGISSSTRVVNFGQRPFAYTAPSGFKALCTQNLPTPTIGATTATQAGKFFNPVLYTGNGDLQSVTVGFQPDWVWLKSRSVARNHRLMDTVRGINYVLSSDLTTAEYAGSALSSINSSGFTLNSTDNQNVSSEPYVAWNWRASNATAVTNTSGSITSTVSANTTSGFSVVTFTASANSGSIGHGLGVAPSMIILKSRNNTSNWVCYHASLGADKYILLESTGSAVTNTATWQNTTPTSTVFYSNGPFATGWTEVAYCFAEVAGYSKFGSYTGNGVADGPFVFTGFRPAYVMIKNTTLASAWIVYDNKRNTANVETNYLLPNSSGAEATLSSLVLDFTSNGFKIRGDQATINTSNNNYIFACFAESPFKYSLAR